MKHGLVTCLVVTLTASALTAQEPDAPQNEQPVGFEWLKQFEGAWKTDFDGTMHSRIVGDRWLVSEFSFQKGPFSIQTLGFDAKKKKFVGTWVDATSDHIWRYTGDLDESGKVLLLEATGPDLNDPSKMRLYRDSYEFVSADEIKAMSQMQGDDKQWRTFNTGKMIRKKSEPATDR